MYRYVYLKAASSSINYEDTNKTQYHQLFFFDHSRSGLYTIYYRL